jgi:hypothetical protein
MANPVQWCWAACIFLPSKHIFENFGLFSILLNFSQTAIQSRSKRHENFSFGKWANMLLLPSFLYYQSHHSCKWLNSVDRPCDRLHQRWSIVLGQELIYKALPLNKFSRAFTLTTLPQFLTVTYAQNAPRPKEFSRLETWRKALDHQAKDELYNTYIQHDIEKLSQNKLNCLL